MCALQAGKEQEKGQCDAHFFSSVCTVLYRSRRDIGISNRKSRMVTQRLKLALLRVPLRARRGPLLQPQVVACSLLSASDGVRCGTALRAEVPASPHQVLGHLQHRERVHGEEQLPAQNFSYHCLRGAEPHRDTRCSQDDAPKKDGSKTAHLLLSYLCCHIRDVFAHS